MDQQLRQHIASQGLSVEQMWLYLTDLERVDVDTGGQRSAMPSRTGFFARRLEKVYSRLTLPMPVEPGVGPIPARSHAD